MPTKPSPSERPDAPAASAAEPIAFEAAITELESIVDRMESGAMSLEDSLEAYRRGAALVGQCRQSLAAARQQVRILEADLLKPFEPESDDER